ncbi:avidin/streptavidin family protein [Flavilitoribacter nigricans]|uniref:Uncharacterized protein n=1 Tax=Flavilitoribacter nigricans (strain ATCC 23147 / DSM 23189 / NBRC 102662 / NCIMB 1420 / SS-2) TaxID=1122177 RepID=A0A2D0NBI8_FLAN2|nr:avidin/streptavidin family protein [Flavilitoribacter nigricans]PHN05756.1 hypothetical protein CRP01_14870 [Flavilitoribacter nigricans DSM 23189 = NBRC 102662]
METNEATWYGENGSVLKYHFVKYFGNKPMIQFEGTYTQQQESPTTPQTLTGILTFTDDDPPKKVLPIGFVVGWPQMTSRRVAVTSWCGKIRTLENGKEVMETTWIKTISGVEQPTTTETGKETFSQTPPGGE